MKQEICRLGGKVKCVRGDDFKTGLVGEPIRSSFFKDKRLLQSLAREELQLVGSSQTK